MTQCTAVFLYNGVPGLQKSESTAKIMSFKTIPLHLTWPKLHIKGIPVEGQNKNISTVLVATTGRYWNMKANGGRTKYRFNRVSNCTLKICICQVTGYSHYTNVQRVNELPIICWWLLSVVKWCFVLIASATHRKCQTTAASNCFCCRASGAHRLQKDIIYLY